MIRRVLLGFLVFGMVGCGVDVTDPGSVAGTYTLRTFDGEALPTVLGGAGARLVEVLAGSITLNEDLTCSFSTTVRDTEDGIVTTETFTEVCSYTLDSGFITFTTSLGVGVGSISGSTITIVEFDVGVFVYKK